jgi:hypothetical protein
LLGRFAVAEFDNPLEKYHVENESFSALVRGDADIAAGDKGTGNSTDGPPLLSAAHSLPLRRKSVRCYVPFRTIIVIRNEGLNS